MSRSLLLALVLTPFVLPLALAACGDDGESGDEDQISEAIETAATGTDAEEKCTVVVTQSFVEQTQFATGDAAVAACEEEATDAVADSVEVSAIEVDGESATAEAAFTGGSLDGQTLVILVVKEDDRWKLDQLEEFVDFDAQAFAAGLAEEAGAAGDAPQEVVDCVVEQVQSTDPEQVQAAYLSGEQGELLSLFGPCFQQG
ncbi:MAG TPA: hypothetical protein VFT14_04780 [Solirubrobacterales bacterium]|nr:hypothetical protein [Solirubrobacterales bacterium]